MGNESNVVLRFDKVTFGHHPEKLLLEDASFSVRTGSRITLMGQNGAGKSSLLRLITGEAKPLSGQVCRTPENATVALGNQVMPKSALPLAVWEYLAEVFQEVPYNLDKRIRDVFDIVGLSVPIEKKVQSLSGGQQARLLLAHALIQDPDILLLDEPTNNLDQEGIERLTGFLMMYEKTCLVISHDADFLNAFSDGVLYLDVFTKTIEQYVGNYYTVMDEIQKRIERENLQNARLQAQMREKRAQAEVFAHKGGKLRSVAKRMREAAEEAEETMVSVRREDKTIRDFMIPNQEFDAHFHGKILEFNSVSALKNHVPVEKKIDVIVRKKNHLLISGPNGIGKSTLLEAIAARASSACRVATEAIVGYYKQDFSNLNFDQTAYDALKEVMPKYDEHTLRSAAAGFLLDGKILTEPIRALSEGQKGLLSFCRLVLLRPGLLILDEPTNHINFRHLPVIARAFDQYEGAMVLVSHIPDFVSQIRIDETIDLGAIEAD
ncbi:MAG: ATP-binding cassette domain-containing protein [Patescibacteria group bacterium]